MLRLRWLLNRSVVTGLVFIAMVSVLHSQPPELLANDPTVFVSAFAGGEDGAIHTFQLDSETGQLKPLHQTTDVENPFFLALSPDRKFLYSIHAVAFGGAENEEVAAYSIEDPSGQLKFLNRQSARGTASCYLSVDSTGRTVLVANYSSGSVAALPINDDGTLREAASFVQHEGSGVDPKRQTGPNAHCIVVSPNNRFAYAADLGLDKILIYRLDAEKSQLTPNTQPFVRTIPGAGPRHLTFHPDGKHLYAINELKNSVTLFDYDDQTGMLIERQTVSTLPDDFDGTSYCADVKITPDGRYLYGTNRGHHSIAAYAIGSDGTLARIAIVPSLGDGPQNLAITADGKFVICANMPGNNVVIFQIDGETGKLKAVGEPVSVKMPSCIKLLTSD
jgi:6-phosphogluconolactonase